MENYVDSSFNNNEIVATVSATNSWYDREVYRQRISEFYNTKQENVFVHNRAFRDQNANFSEVSEPKNTKLANYRHVEICFKPLEEEDISLNRPKQHLKKTNTDIYLALKKQRDIACARMYQASNALIKIKTVDNSQDWLNILIIEKLLLETGERVNIITSKIADNICEQIPVPRRSNISLHLSSISFPFINAAKESDKKKCKSSNFFVVTASCDTQMEISEFTREEGSKLQFSKSWNFKETSTDFNLHIKLFCLRLPHKQKSLKSKRIEQSVTIIYEDPLLRTYVEKRVMKSSFKLCAETVLNRSHVTKNQATLGIKSELHTNLKPTINFELR